jgi:hypothetical protein
MDKPEGAPKERLLPDNIRSDINGEMVDDDPEQ